MSFASRAAPTWITAVWRSGEIDAGATVATAGSLFSLASTRRSARPNAGSETVLSRAWTTTVRP